MSPAASRMRLEAAAPLFPCNLIESKAAGSQRRLTDPWFVTRGSTAHVPDPHSRTGRPGRRHRGGNAVGRGIPRGRHAQAFPSFGSERTGAPVVAFCRIDDKEIRLREPIQEPECLIVQDADIVQGRSTCCRACAGRLLLVNTSKTLSDLHLDAVAAAPADGPCADRAGDRTGAETRRASGAQRGAARRLRRADRIGAARLVDRAIHRSFPGKVGEAKSAPPGRRMTSSPRTSLRRQEEARC